MRSKLVDIVTAGSQKIALWGPLWTPLGILRIKTTNDSQTPLYLHTHVAPTKICEGKFLIINYFRLPPQISVNRQFIHPSFLYYLGQSGVHCSFIAEPFLKTLLRPLTNSPIFSNLHCLLHFPILSKINLFQTLYLLPSQEELFSLELEL